MSHLETLSEIYPASAELVTIIEGKRKRESSHPQSLVTAFANALIKEGSNRLKDLFNGINTVIAPLSPSQVFFREVPVLTQEQDEALAEIIFGACLVSLDDTIWSGKVDMTIWFAKYNEAISGTPLRPIHITDKAIEVLPWDYLNEILIPLAIEDKTLASLFSEKFRFLPEFLKTVLSESGRLRLIRSRILPFYRERANILVNQHQPQAVC